MVVSNLEEEILEVESELRSTFSALSDLDCILSLAGCAADLNFIRPEIAAEEEGVIQIENGRHPLQELIVDDFIPNHTHIDSDRRMLVVTGPNFSGKSCFARQVGVLVYMLHLGSYLPCDSARISLFGECLRLCVFASSYALTRIIENLQTRFWFNLPILKAAPCPSLHFSEI